MNATSLTFFQLLMCFLLLFFLHWCYTYRLKIDESKSKTNVKSCVEYAVIRYIFRVMYEKIVFAVMDNKSVSVNGSGCLISYVNVVVLLIKILNTI
jgi:hypothetical protein